MRIQLSDHFTYNKLLRFSISTVLMLICTSLYSIVDGFFVSNFVGKQPFAALNLIFPVLMGAAPLCPLPWGRKSRTRPTNTFP